MSNNNNQKNKQGKEKDEKRNTRGIVNLDQTIQKKDIINYDYQFLGLVLFFSIFVIFIPILLSKRKYYTILEGYMPNIDLLATALSWHGGPYDMWTDLYPASPVTKYGFLSQSLINYSALIGLTYIIAREVKITNNIIKGWSMGFVMLLMTYLLPSNLTIIPIMDFTDKFLTKNIPSLSAYKDEIITSIGLLVAFLIIYLESRILKYYRRHLYKLGKKILSIPKLF